MPGFRSRNHGPHVPVDGVWSTRTPGAVLVFFRHDELATELRKWARRNPWDLIWARAGSELTARSYSLSIVDRRLLNPGTWDLYLAFLREVNDGVPLVIDGEEIDTSEESSCILVDDLAGLALPKLPHVLQIMPGTDSFVGDVLKAVRDIARRRTE